LAGKTEARLHIIFQLFPQILFPLSANRKLFINQDKLYAVDEKGEVHFVPAVPPSDKRIQTDNECPRFPRFICGEFMQIENERSSLLWIKSAAGKI
jgi:hypothetical protein